MVRPRLSARPLRARICASYPSGNSINKPVGISARPIGWSVTGASRLARKSMPALPVVSYLGSGFAERLMIRIVKAEKILVQK